MKTINPDLDSIELDPINQQHHIDIVSPSPNQPSRSVLLILPREVPLEGKREDFIALCVPLYNALINDNLEAAKVILEEHRELVKFSIIDSYETALHIAISCKSHKIVRYLVSLMSNDDLELQNGNGETALYVAARDGNRVGARILMERNKCLIDIPDSQGRMPFYAAVLSRYYNVSVYLYHNFQKMSGHLWTHQNRSRALEACVESRLYGIAIDMLTNHPELAVNGKLLRILAEARYYSFSDPKPIFLTLLNILKHINSILINSDYDIFQFWVKGSEAKGNALKLLRIILNEIMKLSKAEIDDIMRGPPDETNEDTKQKYSSRALFLAVEKGNTGFVAEVIRQCPRLALEVNDDNQSILHVAASHRRLGIFKVVIKNKHITNRMVTLEDENGNNMLHLAASGNSALRIPRSYLRLNQEFIWFREVAWKVPLALRYRKNASGLTPFELFVTNHKDLFSNQEKRIKDTASQLMVVAALVATISFAAVFTFPGGYNQDTGIPIFLRKNLFKIFIIFDSMSFISSATSVLMVLSIIHSKYTTYDLIISKPNQLGICIVLVFFSIATIILTFLIILFILYGRNSIWMPIVISVSAAVTYLISAFRQYLHRDRNIRLR